MNFTERIAGTWEVFSGRRAYQKARSAVYETTIGWRIDDSYEPVYGPTASGELEYTRLIRPAKPEPEPKAVRQIAPVILQKLLKATGKV